MALYTVFGGRGFVGAEVVRQLSGRGDEVRIVGRGEAAEEGPLGRIIFCAGLTGDYRAYPFQAVEAHVSLLARVVEGGDFERLVYLSSTRVYDASPEAVGTEDAPLVLDPTDPEHIFALTKALGENLTVTRTQGRGIAARLSYVYDEVPGSAGFLSEWLDQARRSRKLTLASAPGFSRDYIHRQDAARALVAMADSDRSGIFNLAQGRLTSNAELAAVFERAGWAVRFDRHGGAPLTCAPSVDRLAEFDVRPRDVRDRVADYLATLA